MQIVQNFRTWWHGISPTTGSNNFLTDSTSHLSGMEDHWIPKWWSRHGNHWRCLQTCHFAKRQHLTFWYLLNEPTGVTHLLYNPDLTLPTVGNGRSRKIHLPGPKTESILKIHQNLTACSIMFMHAPHQNGFLAFSPHFFPLSSFIFMKWYPFKHVPSFDRTCGIIVKK